MRTSRRSTRWLVIAVVAAAMAAGGGWAASAHGATPTPTDTPTETPVPTEAPTPTATPTPAPRAEIDCDATIAEVVGDGRVVPGENFQIRFAGFAPGASLTIVWVDIDLPEQSIGTATASPDGSGIADVVVPADAAIQEASVQVRGDQCAASADIVVLGSPDSIDIDDATPSPGQVVTVTASGFGPHEVASLSIDSAPTQGECFPRECQFLAFGTTSAAGAVTLRGRIPRDAQRGSHRLWVTSTQIEGISDDYRSIEIFVGLGATVPPTDTEPGG